ncbi:hypothetical protein [Fictibacillus sp. NRS-1165]|uniref:hypothetical protein n=1 Tax=Fictibacillus sp. NRS-1165 TaxID=3144463 RepID=UPI003D1CCD33
MNKLKEILNSVRRSLRNEKSSAIGFLVQPIKDDYAKNQTKEESVLPSYLSNQEKEEEIRKEGALQQQIDLHLSRVPGPVAIEEHLLQTRELFKQIFEEGKDPALEEKRFKEEAIRCFSDIIREKEKLQLPQFREEDFRDSEIKRI